MFILDITTPVGIGGAASATPKPPAPITNWNQLENALFQATGSRSLTIPANITGQDRNRLVLQQAGVILRAMTNPQFRDSLTSGQGAQIKSTIHEANEIFLRLVHDILRP